jgi:hypothetical protein
MCLLVRGVVDVWAAERECALFWRARGRSATRSITQEASSLPPTPAHRLAHTRASPPYPHLYPLSLLPHSSPPRCLPFTFLPRRCRAWIATWPLAARTDRRSVLLLDAELARREFLADKSSLQRTHSQMENEGSSSPTWPTLHRFSASREPSIGSPSSHPQVSGLHLPRLANMPPTHPRRYPGDGFDYRRPMSLSAGESQAAVIDLTADDAGPSVSSSSRPSVPRGQRPQRPPRFANAIFANEIIDIEAEDVRRSAAPPDSPELEFISSRRIDPSRRDPPPPRPREEDDLEIIGSNTVPREQRQHRWVGPGGLGAMLMAIQREDDLPPGRGFDHLRQRIQRAANNMRPPVIPPRGGGRGGGRGRIHVGFVAPNMDFEMVAFDMGLGGGPAPPPPTYDAPEPVPEGFTRSPQENEVYACPNCGDELCAGESDAKRQVWIVKGCGHVRLHRTPVNDISVLTLAFRSTVVNVRSTDSRRRASKARKRSLQRCINHSSSAWSKAATRRHRIRSP